MVSFPLEGIQKKKRPRTEEFEGGKERNADVEARLKGFTNAEYEGH